MNDRRCDTRCYLVHHGIKGQQWGVKNGPPYPLQGGKYEVVKKKHRITPSLSAIQRYKIYKKRNKDAVIKKGTNIQTLSYDPARTKDAEYFFGAYNKGDKHLYNALFNRKISTENGDLYKYAIKNSAKKDIKVASESSSIKAFSDIFKKDRDFYNFVKDPERMESHFVKSKYKFKGYRESKSSLEKLRSGKQINSEDIAKIYRMFNYTIPSDGGGDEKRAADVRNQRQKLFNILKENGYSALLDTNDAIYGSFKANEPVIVFDQSAIIPDSIKMMKTSDVTISTFITAGRKALGL